MARRLRSGARQVDRDHPVFSDPRARRALRELLQAVLDQDHERSLELAIQVTFSCRSEVTLDDLMLF